MFKRFVCTSLFLLSMILSAYSQNLAPVNALDPVYGLLEKAYAHGWIDYLPQIKPLPLGEVLSALSRTRAALGKVTGPVRDRTLAEIDAAEARLARPFSGPVGTQWGEGESSGSAYMTFPLSSSSSTVLAKPANTEWIGTLGIYGGVSWGSVLYLGMENEFITAFRPNAVDPETSAIYRGYPDRNMPDVADYNLYTLFFGLHDDGFNHNQIHYPGDPDVSIQVNTRTQAVLNFDFGNLGLVRQKTSWGPGSRANLMLSGTAKPFDALSLSLNLGESGRFVWNTGFIRQETTEGAGLFRADERMVTMHRIEYQFTPWFMFSIYESIVYENRFELGYLNPFSLYYVSEVRNGDNDNKFGGADFIFRFPGVKTYLSLFADDWDFGEMLNFGYFHNIFGAQAGITVWDVIPGLTLQGEYVYLSHWMYTHRLGNKYIHFNESLGYPLEPNSHRFTLGADYSIDPQTGFGLDVELTQHGDGGYYVDGVNSGWDINGLYATLWNGVLGSYHYLDIGIPDAYLETTLKTRVSAQTSLPWQGFSIEGGYTFQYQDNADRVLDYTRINHFVDVSFSFAF